MDLARAGSVDVFEYAMQLLTEISFHVCIIKRLIYFWSEVFQMCIFERRKNFFIACCWNFNPSICFFFLSHLNNLINN